MKYAFITGAAGFIGGYCAREFVDEGWHVFALVHRKPSRILDELAQSGNLTLIHGDLNDFERFENDLKHALDGKNASLDAIIHCAGRASDVGRRSEFRRTNYDAVRNLGGMAVRLGVHRFVFVSTTDVYGMRDFNGEQEADLPLVNNTGNPYPEFKIAAENWIRENMQPDQYAIIRPAAVWGVGDKTLTPRIVSFLKSSPFVIHFGKWRGQNRWPLAHVRNVAGAVHLAALLPDAAGQAINVLDNEISSIDEFYNIIASVFLPGKAFRTVTLPMWVGQAFGCVVSAVSNALNLDHPFTDPSLYALYSVSSNLDFGNQRMNRLFESGGRRVITREEGLSELQEQDIE